MIARFWFVKPRPLPCEIVHKVHLSSFGYVTYIAFLCVHEINTVIAVMYKSDMFFSI